VAILVGLHALHLIRVVWVGLIKVRVGCKNWSAIPAGGDVQETRPYLLAVFLAIAAVIRIVSTCDGKVYILIISN